MIRTLALTLILIGTPCLIADDDGQIRVIAFDGDAGPNGDGVFNGFTNPILNDAGQVVFRAGLSNVDQGTSGIFRFDGDFISTIARSDQPVPSGNGTFGVFSFGDELSFSDSGHVAFHVFINGTTSGQRNGLYIGNGESIQKVIREGDTAPDGNGVIASFESNRIALNDFGQVALAAHLTNTSGGLGWFNQHQRRTRG